MSVERTYYCEDDADTPPPVHVRTATPPPHLPVGVIETRERYNGEDSLHHFCSWDCLMKFAARQPIPETADGSGWG